MLYDPLITLLRSANWWLFWLTCAFLDISVNIFFSFKFGGKKRVREFFSDPLSLMWPFFILGPIAGGYVYINQVSNAIRDNFSLLKLNYSSYSIGFQNYQGIYLVVLFLAFIVALSTRLRYEKYKPNIWFSKPKFFGRIRTLIIDFPMGYMAIMSLLMLIDQWTVVEHFLSSTWLPQSPFNEDGLYGIYWLYQQLVTQIVIALIISISPLIMLLREKKQRYSWIYKILFSSGVIFILIVTLVLAMRLNNKIDEIYSGFASAYFAKISNHQSITNSQDINFLLQQITLGLQTNMLMDLPDKFFIPSWLGGLVSIRLFLFVFAEIYLNLATKYSWSESPKFVKKLMEILK